MARSPEIDSKWCNTFSLGNVSTSVKSSIKIYAWRQYSNAKAHPHTGQLTSMPCLGSFSSTQREYCNTRSKWSNPNFCKYRMVGNTPLKGPSDCFPSLQFGQYTVRYIQINPLLTFLANPKLWHAILYSCINRPIPCISVPFVLVND